MIVPLSLAWLAGHGFYRALGFRSRRLRAGERDLHLYDRAGTGRGPPALLVHGLGGNAYSFTPLLRTLLRDCRRVTAIELPGHGRSRLLAAEDPATIAECAQAVGRVLTGDVREPALLIGSSLGGAIALSAAIEFPQCVAGVVGLNPAGAPLRGRDRLEVLAAFRGGTAQDALETNRRLYRNPPRLGWLFARGLARHWASRPVQGLVRELQEDQPGIAPGLLRSISRPVLILWGRDDRVLPLSSLDYFRAHLPSAAVELVDASGHLPQLEQAALVAARVSRFVGAL